MAGIYLNENRVKMSIECWADAITSSNGKWEGKNLHIDEIDSLDKIIREEWVNVSFNLLNILTTRMKQSASFVLFLHIDLKYSIEKLSVKTLSLNWLKKNISEYTPPSLHYTSMEYYVDFYEKELVTCKPDDSILEIVNSSTNLIFFYRTYFDVEEEMYSREIYIFIKNREMQI